MGHISIIRFAPEESAPNTPKWLGKCACGKIKTFHQGHLIRGKSLSCGCVGKTQGGHAGKHPMYWRWNSMLERCKSVNANNYKNYGGRGIKVCERWHSFELFLEDMGPTFFKGASLERIDNDGDYEPTNVEWATCRQQNNNKRNTVIIDTPWGRMARADAARKAGVRLSLFICRHNRGWPMERLFDPSNRGPIAR